LLCHEAVYYDAAGLSTPPGSAVLSG